jgi:Fungal specific transcription factor domain
MSQSRWQFIDSSKDSADNLTQVKRHVMQEYMRQKRRENKHEEGTSDEQTNPTKKTARRSRARKTNAQPQARSVVPAGEGPASQYFQDIPSAGTGYADFGAGFASSALQQAWSVSLSPRTILSAARTDPFDTLPWQATKEDQRLFDFYVNEMPSCSYGHHYRSKRAHNWYTEVFVPEAMKGPLTFVNTILVHGANTWAWVRNETETDSTLRYRQLGISMLRDHTQKYPHDMTDNVITACMSAAALEDFDPRPGHKEISWIHMRQAQKLIRRRGGPAAFENTILARLINWQDYILAGYVSDPGGFYFEDNYRLPDATRPSPNPSWTACLPSPPNSASPAASDRTPSPTRNPLINTPDQEIALQCEEFLDFLCRCERLALNQRITLPPNNATVRQTAFEPGSTLRNILISPTEKRRLVTGDRKQFIARLAALLMLNAALWDYRLSISKTEAFLEHSILQLHDSEVNLGASIEALLQILLACKDFPFDESFLNPASLSPDVADFSQYSATAASPFARPWFVGRMLKVAKRLGFQTWLRLNNFLFECLTLQVQEHTMLSWGPLLRHEILQAPLTSYVMPALQEAVFLGV